MYVLQGNYESLRSGAFGCSDHSGTSRSPSGWYFKSARLEALLSGFAAGAFANRPTSARGLRRAFFVRAFLDSVFTPQTRSAALNGTLQVTDLGTVCAFIDETLHARAVHRVFYHRMCFGSGSTARGLLVRSEQLRRFDSEGRITQASAAVRLGWAALRLAYCMVKTAGPARGTAGNADDACCAPARPNADVRGRLDRAVRCRIAWASKPPGSIPAPWT